MTDDRQSMVGRSMTDRWSTIVRRSMVDDGQTHDGGRQSMVDSWTVNGRIVDRHMTTVGQSTMVDGWSTDNDGWLMDGRRWMVDS